MLVSVFSTSTAFGYWGFAVAAFTLDVVYGSHKRIHCLTIEELRSDWQKIEGTPILVTSDLPHVKLVNLLVNSGFPSIVFTDEPEDCITAAMRQRQMALGDAIRFSTHCFSALDDVLRAPNVIQFGSQCFFERTLDVIERLIEAVVGSVDPDSMRKILERAIPDYREGDEQLTVGDVMARQNSEAWAPGRGLAELTTSDRGLVERVSDAYRPIFGRRELVALSWPRELFTTSDESPVSLADVNLTGGARFLFWGPYLFLPRGNWQANVQFEVVGNHSGNRFEAEICIGRDVEANGQGKFPSFGAYGFSMNFTIVDPGLSIEFRARLLEGAIEGKFGLLSVSFERLSE